MKKFSRNMIILFVVVTLCTIGFCIYNNQSNKNTLPTISIAEDTILVSVNATEADLLKGVTAYDNEDGDITSGIVIESISGFIKKDTRVITYAAFDSHNSVVTASRNIIYTDYKSPEFEITQNLQFNNTINLKAESFAKAKDVIDGDITSKIKLQLGEPDSLNIYPATISVSNSCGDTSSLQVYIKAGTASIYSPVIDLSEYVSYVNVGQKVNLRSYIKSVSTGNTNVKAKPEEVIIDGNVDENTPGTYTVKYIYENTLGLSSVVYLNVVVR